jgi:hypothetical protein
MRRQRRNKVASFHPFVEILERRCVPATITPTTFADGGLGSGSLRDAVLQFNADTGTDDDTIQLQAGTYALTIQNVGGRHETAGLTGDLNLTQASHHWIIQGAGPPTIIDASQLQDRVFDIVTPGTQVVFRDLVIQGGLAQDNGSNGTLAGTTDALGGGLLNNGGNVTLDHVVVQNNVARGGDVAVLQAPGHNASGGAIYSTGGALTIAGATIANNQATGGRGGDHNGVLWAGFGGSATGGGLYATGGYLDISNSTISTNRATGGRGGDGIPTKFNPSGNGGQGGTGQGGGLYVNGGSLTIASSTIASNQGTGGSAGLYGYTGLGQGGGLDNGGTLTVTGSTLSGNSATDNGAGLNGGGGAINNDGTLTISDSTLSGNFAGQGGGIQNRGTLTVSNSTLFGNSGGLGGGIYNFGGTLMVRNSTLSGNSADLWGGGIYEYFDNPQHVTLTNVTLTANRCGSSVSSHGGGLFVPSAFPPVSPVLHNTLIAGNFRGATGTTADDAYGPLDASGDYNLIGDGTGLTGLSDGVNDNLVGSAAAPIVPLLGPLQNNGGPTQTMALLPGSPAIDAGGNTYATATDQRGFARIVGGTIDIGAYEVQPAGQATHLSIQAPASISAGTPVTITVTALDDFGQPATGYTGTVHFVASNGATADYTFTAADMGQHAFSNLVFPWAGTYTVAGADTANPLITGSTTFTITPAAAAQIAFSLPSTITAGVPFSITVTVQDAYGNTVTGYTGTVHFTTTDTATGVVLPPDYTFTAADGGTHTFTGGFTLVSPGDQTLTAADPDNGFSTDYGLHVDPGA